MEALSSVIKDMSSSFGVPIMSKIDSKTWPSVVGKPSFSILAFFGLAGKQWVPWKIYKDGRLICTFWLFSSSQMYLKRSAIITPHDHMSMAL